MTEEWWNNIYRKAGNDIFDAMTQRLLQEFSVLGNCEKTIPPNDAPSDPSAGDEKA
ncbi:MAG: hypothetical protein RL156_1774 [Bacteroidota bacterium]|jgi:hypothetical protein